MKRKALLIYYSQCGQTKTALEYFSAELEKTFEISELEVRPKTPYEFPWKMTKFFRAFPRCVKEDYPEINDLTEEFTNKDYDLVVIGYQIWFLSPSLPAQALIHNPDFKKLIKGKDVAGIVTSRNMWISGVGIINKRLQDLGAKSVKNLVLCDTAPAWATFVTTPRWMLTGKKAAFSIFPEAGIARAEFSRAARFAAHISNNAPNDDIFNCSHPQTEGNVIMEKIGRPFFKCWAAPIYALTDSDGLFRDFLLVLFRINLIILILTLLPLVAILMIIRGEKPNGLHYKNELLPTWKSD